MLGNTYATQVCSIARALEVVGERWTLLILRDATFAGTTRYIEFQRRLGIATNVLSDRLDGLVQHGLMVRRGGDRDGVDYDLTDQGRDLTTALAALTEWGDRYAAPNGPPIVYSHATCGGSVRTVLVCSGCGQVVDPADVRAEPGPGMPSEHLERMKSLRRRSARRDRQTSGQVS
jgi:DNA-binding HxlR family transcriptional regulator